MNFKNKVIYQIWLRSFKDSNGDGIGDIGGMIEKVDYIASLGVDYVWISPLYKSSNKDYGYDIDDYYSINPEFGSMEDFDLLLERFQEKNIGIIMDLVANHTSDQHEWFQSAVHDLNSPYRDFYFFKEGKNGKEPNNWISMFGGSAWQRDPLTENGYYLATFTPNQCDLNWENPEVRKEIYKIMHFWLKKGIAGFRLDVINTIAKADGLPDKNPNKKGYQFAKELMINRPKSHEYIKEMHEEVLSKYDCITIGEGMLVDQEACRQYAGANTDELQMMITFDLHMMDCGPLGKFDFRKLYRWNVLKMKKILHSWQMDMQKHNYWLANCLSNHDQPRHISRWGNDQEYRVESAKAFAMLNLTLRGTPFIYQGEEIGMTNYKLEQDEWRDFEAINIYQELQTMMHVPKFLAKKIVQKMSRDNARTPMQWSSKLNAGFSSVQPWIKLNSNYQEINVEADLKNEQSLIEFYRTIIQLRKEHPALAEGSYKAILAKNNQVMGYYRESEEEKLLIIINLSQSPAAFYLPIEKDENYKLLLKTDYGNFLTQEKMVFKPYEGRIYKITKKI